MPKAGTPQTPPQAPKASPNDTTPGMAEKAPEIESATPPIQIRASVADPILEAEKLAQEIEGATGIPPGMVETFKGLDFAIPTEMIAGTPANPKTMALPTDEVSAFALIRSNDGMWRAVQYRIKGATVLQVRTKEPDLKALLAAQITDCLALDMPLFNDEEAPRE